MKETLYNDSAVAGEAAGLAMGLTMLGRPTNEIKDEMLLYAHETQHEKIIRGLAIGVAFLYYGRQEEADQVVKDMCADGVCTCKLGNCMYSFSAQGSHHPLRWRLHPRLGVCGNSK